MSDLDLDLDSTCETELEKIQIRAWTLHVRHAPVYTREQLVVVPVACTGSMASTRMPLEAESIRREYSDTVVR